MVIVEGDALIALVDVNGSNIHMGHASVLGQYRKEGDKGVVDVMGLVIVNNTGLLCATFTLWEVVAHSLDLMLIKTRD